MQFYSPLLLSISLPCARYGSPMQSTLRCADSFIDYRKLEALYCTMWELRNSRHWLLVVTRVQNQSQVGRISNAFDCLIVFFCHILNRNFKESCTLAKDLSFKQWVQGWKMKFCSLRKFLCACVFFLTHKQTHTHAQSHFSGGNCLFRLMECVIPTLE